MFKNIKNNITAAASNFSLLFFPLGKQNLKQYKWNSKKWQFMDTFCSWFDFWHVLIWQILLTSPETFDNGSFKDS